MDYPLWAFGALAALVVIVVILDVAVFGRNPHKVTLREAGWWSAGYIAMGIAFGGLLWLVDSPQAAGDYLAGYLVEKSLSMDNVFVFAMIFTYFAVPVAYRQRALLWGIVGALVLRAIFILIGAAMLQRFDWTPYLFGAILLYSAWKMARHEGAEIHPEHNPVLKLVRRVSPMSSDWNGQRLTVRERGKRLLTPMAAVLLVIMTTDIIFAVDSIPAIFAITDVAFIVLAANVFALLGLRALYFLLEGMMERFIYLQAGLALLLGFIGLKMLAQPSFGKLPIEVSLAAIVGVVGGSIAVSMVRTRELPHAAGGASVEDDPDARAERERAMDEVERTWRDE